MTTTDPPLKADREELLGLLQAPQLPTHIADHLLDVHLELLAFAEPHELLLPDPWTGNKTRYR